MVEVGTATTGEKEIKTDWPVEEGLVAGTTKQEGRVSNLVAQERSTVLERYRKGL
jgi:hypothetical protein